MKNLPVLLILIIILSACDTTTNISDLKQEINIIPQPKEVSISQNTLILSDKSKLFTAKEEIQPLLDLFSAELESLTGISLASTDTKNEAADIVFEINPGLAEESYTIHIDKAIQVSGGSYHALTMAKTSLLQLATKEGEALAFPIVQIKDNPDVAYRGLLVDIARKWHSFESLKSLVDLAAYYKINYLQLHFTDYQSYTLPSTKYPKLSTPDRHYSFDQLRELEAYSQLRGVTIIPEIDIPGHSSPFVEMYPEIFAIKDKEDNPWIINMGKESVYEALDHIIGEITDIFSASPYYHIGGDEAIFNKVMDDPDVQEYARKNEIEADAHEVYRHFLVRMNEIVKKHGKQMCLWEGFRREGNIEIPKDVIVFEFETNRYLPNHLVEDGYTVVNTSWKPLYVVNKKKWEPKTIYSWNLWYWSNWWPKAPSFTPIQVEKSNLVIGAQMCAWEQAEEVEIPSLRKRLPTFLERIWNTEEKIPFEQFMSQLEATDQKLSVLLDDDRQDDLLEGHNFTKEMEGQ